MSNFETNSILHYRDYRQYLRHRLEHSSRKRKGYSMRAFARDLKLSAPRLSNVLHGKSGLSVEAGIGLATRLGLNIEETEYFCDLIQQQHARSKTLRQFAKAKIARKQPDSKTRMLLSEEVFSLIASFHHYAILQLLHLPGFKDDPRWVAKRLGISIVESQAALGRLKELGLMVRNGKKWVRAENSLITSQDVPSEALRQHHASLLEEAGKALHSQGVDEREFHSVIFAINRKNLAKAKKLIREFRAQMENLLEQGERSDVYALSTQLFRLSKNEMDNE